MSPASSDQAEAEDGILSGETIFVHEGAAVSQRDVVRVLREVGLGRGDVCFVHSSLLPIGRPAMPREKTMDLLIAAFEHVLGPEGTLAMPAFTFSFCRGQVFDVARSKSTAGALTEHFRLSPGVVRTKHPIYSVCVRGPRAPELVATNNEDCFGEGTLLAKLYELDAKTVTFGSGFPSTFKHHVEQMHGVPYRYFKTFAGRIVDGDRTYEASCTFYVRRLELGWVKDSRRLQARMVAAGALKVARVGGAEVTCTRARDLYDHAWRMLDEDVYSLMKQQAAG